MPRTLAENAQYIAETIKPAIKQAIEAQGVTVPSTDSFLDYADRIAEIEGGGSGYQLKDLPTGSISTVSDAEPLLLNALTVSVEAWQEGSGDPSPSNVRSIHGWSTATINNISNYYIGSPSFDGYSNLSLWTKLDETYRGHEVYKRSSAWNGIYKTIALPVGVYTFSASVKTSDGANVNVYFVRNDSTATTNIDEAEVLTTTNWARISATFEVLQEGTVAVRIERATAGDIYISEYQIERGNTAHNYCHYQTKTYTHAFTDSQGNPLTCYGGEWNVVDGELDNTKNSVVLDGVTTGLKVAGFDNYGNNNRFYIYYSNVFPQAKYQSSSTYCLCDKIKPSYAGVIEIAPSMPPVYACYPHSLSFFITLPSAEYPDVASANSFLQQNNVQVVYELATPQTIQLSPLSIRLLEGTNNLFADCGEVIEGEYFVDEGAHRYQLYDYIESDGTQCIDLGRQVVQGQTVKTIFHPMSDQIAYAWLFGSGDTSHYYGFQFPQSTILMTYNGSTSASSQRSVSTADENVYNLAFTASDSLALNYYVFGIDYNETPDNLGKFRLYLISVNGDSFLPCKRKSDGVFGLYDVANSQFLTDSANGNPFVGGNPTGVEV